MKEHLNVAEAVIAKVHITDLINDRMNMMADFKAYALEAERDGNVQAAEGFKVMACSVQDDIKILTKVVEALEDVH